MASQQTGCNAYYSGGTPPPGGGGGVSEDAARERDGSGEVPFDQHLAGVPVAGAGADHEGLVGVIHGARSPRSVGASSLPSLERAGARNPSRRRSPADGEPGDRPREGAREQRELGFPRRGARRPRRGRRPPDEPIAASVCRLDEAWRARVVAERAAELADAAGEHRRRDDDTRPDRIEQLVLRHEPPAVESEVFEHRERLPAKPYGRLAAQEAAAGAIEPVGAERHERVHRPDRTTARASGYATNGRAGASDRRTHEKFHVSLIVLS